MRSVPAQAAALCGMLAAATGAEPRTTTTLSSIRIEADLPDSITPTTRNAILTALAIADRYGHARTNDGGTVWAELDMEAGQ